jgi:hypothetical protein
LQRKEAAGKIELAIVGQYSGSWIPWKGGMHLPERYVIRPRLGKDATLPFNMGTRFDLMEQAETALYIGTGRIEADLWLQIDAAYFLKGRPKHGQVFTVATDPHVLDYDMQRAQSDKFFSMQRVYAKPGDIYLPYAYDVEWHAPLPWRDQFDNDAALAGLHYTERDKLVSRIRSRGLKVNYDLGPIGDEARELYGGAPIGLSWSSKLDLVARVFELTAMGRLAVVNRVPDIDLFFEDGKNLIICDSIDEATEAVVHYSGHLDEARTIAERAAIDVMPNSYDARIDQILNEAGLL